MIRVEQVKDKSVTQRKLIAIFLAVGLSVIAAVIMALITTKVVNRERPDLVAKVILPEQEFVPEMKKVNEELAEQASASAASGVSASVIQTDISAMIDLPKINPVETSLMGFGTGDFGSGFGNGNGNGLGSGGVGSMRGVMIAGVNVRAQKLGVILDISGSMQSYLPKLRRDIEKEFKDAEFLEVIGCRLEESREFSPENIPDGVERVSVMNAVRELVEVDKVDAIFWFSDLQDGHTDTALLELSSVMLRGAIPKKVEKVSGLDIFKKKEIEEPEDAIQPCRLYIKSVGRRAARDLKKVVEMTGGSSR